jgi:pilus assembly protein Flp/PilA
VGLLKEKAMYVFTLLNAPLREESGQDLIEYALIAALVALGAIAYMGTLSNQISNEFNTIGNNFQALSSFLPDHKSPASRGSPHWALVLFLPQYR